jgi:hypothetical protein
LRARVIEVRASQLLAGYLSNLQQRHMDIDHLGTPRLITNFGGTQVVYHVYLPYGVEATSFAQDAERPFPSRATMRAHGVRRKRPGGLE